MRQRCFVWSKDDHTHQAISTSYGQRMTTLIRQYQHRMVKGWPHSSGNINKSLILPDGYGHPLTIRCWYCLMSVVILWPYDVDIAWWVWSSFDHTKQRCRIKTMNWNFATIDHYNEIINCILTYSRLKEVPHNLFFKFPPQWLTATLIFW